MDLHQSTPEQILTQCNRASRPGSIEKFLPQKASLVSPRVVQSWSCVRLAPFAPHQVCHWLKVPKNMLEICGNIYSYHRWNLLQWYPSKKQACPTAYSGIVKPNPKWNQDRKGEKEAINASCQSQIWVGCWAGSLKSQSEASRLAMNIIV